MTWLTAYKNSAANSTKKAEQSTCLKSGFRLVAKVEKVGKVENNSSSTQHGLK